MVSACDGSGLIMHSNSSFNALEFAYFCEIGARLCVWIDVAKHVSDRPVLDTASREISIHVELSRI
jgi:hypothetical protein